MYLILRESKEDKELVGDFDRCMRIFQKYACLFEENICLAYQQKSGLLIPLIDYKKDQKLFYWSQEIKEHYQTYN